MTLGATAWLALRWLEVGSADVWGAYWIANTVGFAVGVIVMNVGVVGLGTWLRSEKPVTITDSSPVTA